MLYQSWNNFSTMQTTNQLHKFENLQVQVVGKSILVTEYDSTTVLDLSLIDNICISNNYDVEISYKYGANTGCTTTMTTTEKAKDLYDFLSKTLIDYTLSKQPSLI